MKAPQRKPVPKIGAPDTSGIPREMRQAKRWTCWKFSWDKETLKKPPCDASGRMTSGLDPANWSDGVSVITAARKSNGGIGAGFALGNGWCGIDLDDCISEDALGEPVLADWAERIVRPNGRIETYCEISPSGTGVKLWFKSDALPNGKDSRVRKSPDLQSQIEVYADRRYFAATGKRFEDAPDIVTEAAATIAAAWAQMNSWQADVDAAKPTHPPVSTAEPRLARDDANRVLVPAARTENAATPLPQKIVVANSETSAGLGRNDGAYAALNKLALQCLPSWVPVCFPTAKARAGGAYEIPSATFGSASSDNLQISPLGARDFGYKGEADGGGRSPIDLMMPPYGECRTHHEAFCRLADLLGLDALKIASLGTALRNAEIVSREPVDVFAPRPTLGPVATWSVGILPPELDAYCRNAADKRGGDLDLTRTFALTVLGAAIPAGVRLLVYGDTDWKCPASLYVGAVGYSGSSKSPSLDPFLEPLEALTNEWGYRYRAEYAAYARRLKAWKEKPSKGRGPEPEKPEPQRRRLGTTVNPEGAVKTVAATEDGIIVVPDELTSWFGSFDQYAGRGKLASADQSFWIRAYEGKRDDKMRQDDTRSHAAPVVLASALGGIQPEIVSEILPTLGKNGLAQRFLFRLAPDRRKPADIKLDTDGKQRYAAAVRLVVDCNRDVAEIANRVFLTPTPEAVAIMREADSWSYCRYKQMPEDDPLRGVLSKSAGTVARLTMALHVLKWAWREAGVKREYGDLGESLPETVEATTVRAAFDLFRDFFWPSILQVYAEAEAGSERRDAVTIGRKLLALPEGERSGIRLWDFGRFSRKFRGEENRGRTLAAIKRLETDGWLLRAGDGKFVSWEVNPRAYELFSGRSADV